MEIEIQELKNSVNSWKWEIKILKEQQINTQTHLANIETNLKTTNVRQQNIRTFISKAHANPGFLNQIIYQIYQEPEMSSNNGSAGGSITRFLPFMMPKLTKSIHEATTPFLSKTFEMADDPNTDSIISWSLSATSFFLRDTDKLKDFLRKYFGHDNVSKFTKRLLEYGFARRDKFLQEYAHERFQKDKKYMIKSIKSQKQNRAMKKNMLNDKENALERLRFYRKTSMEDISRSQQQQETVRKYLAAAKWRLQSTIYKFEQKREDGNAGVSTQSSLAFLGHSRIDRERSELMHKRTETRPWLNPTKFGAKAELEKGKNDLKQLEGEILNMEIRRGFMNQRLMKCIHHIVKICRYSSVGRNIGE